MPKLMNISPKMLDLTELGAENDDTDEHVPKDARPNEDPAKIDAENDVTSEKEAINEHHKPESEDIFELNAENAGKMKITNKSGSQSVYFRFRDKNDSLDHVSVPGHVAQAGDHVLHTVQHDHLLCDGVDHHESGPVVDLGPGSIPQLFRDGCSHEPEPPEPDHPTEIVARSEDPATDRRGLVRGNLIGGANHQPPSVDPMWSWQWHHGSKNNELEHEDEHVTKD